MNFIFENGEPREAQRGDTPTHVLVPLVQVVRDVDGGDWSEVQALGQVVYRGHDDEAKDYALQLLGAEMVWSEPVSGERIHVPVEQVRDTLSGVKAEASSEPDRSDPLWDLILEPDHDPDADEGWQWSVIADLRAPGSPDGGMSDDANYAISDKLSEVSSVINFDPEFSCFYAYGRTKADIEALIPKIREAVLERRGVMV